VGTHIQLLMGISACHTSLDAAEVEDNMNKGVVPEVLKSELKAIGFRDDELPLRIEKIKEGEWEAIIIPEEKEQAFYPKEQKYFFIKKDGAKLYVYRYSFIKMYVEEGHH